MKRSVKPLALLHVPDSSLRKNLTYLSLIDDKDRGNRRKREKLRRVRIDVIRVLVVVDSIVLANIEENKITKVKNVPLSRGEAIGMWV